MGLDLIHFTPVKKGDGDDGCEPFWADELAEHPHYLTIFKDYLVKGNGDGHWLLYYKTLGYQRKGMNLQFYEDFKPDGLFFKLADVMKAYNYLKEDHINTLAELKRNFQANFIDNFVEGRSVFVVSY